MRTPDTNSSAQAFTLLEILTVFTIIGVLAALLFPVFSVMKEQANVGKCASNMRQWGMGFQGYMNDNDGFLPQQGRDITSAATTSETHWQELIAKYLVGDQKNYNQRNVLRALHKCPGEKIAGGVVYGGNLYLDPTQNKSASNPVPKKLNTVDTSLVSLSDLVLMADNYTGEFWLLAPKPNPTTGGVNYNRHKKVANFLMADFHMEAISYEKTTQRGLTTKYNPAL